MTTNTIGAVAPEYVTRATTALLALNVGSIGHAESVRAFVLAVTPDVCRMSTSEFEAWAKGRAFATVGGLRGAWWGKNARNGWALLAATLDLGDGSPEDRDAAHDLVMGSGRHGAKALRLLANVGRSRAERKALAEYLAECAEDGTTLTDAVEYIAGLKADHGGARKAKPATTAPAPAPESAPESTPESGAPVASATRESQVIALLRAMAREGQYLSDEGEITITTMVADLMLAKAEAVTA